MSECDKNQTAELAGRLNSSCVLSGAAKGVVQFTGKLDCNITVGGYNVDTITVSREDDLIFTLLSGEKINLGHIGTEENVSFKQAYINADGHFVIVFSTDNELDCGYISTRSITTKDPMH